MYVVTVKEIKTVSYARRDWQMLIKEANGQQTMGWTPEVDSTRDESRDLYEQTVETLDLPAVILAVNGMPPAA